MNKIEGGCSTCGYPITAEQIGERVSCPYCGIGNIATGISQGVTLPTPLVVGLVAFGLGVLLGPTLIASTEAGQKWLTKKAQEKIK